MQQTTQTEVRYIGQCAPRFGGCGQRLAVTTTTDQSSEKWVTCPAEGCGKRARLRKVEGQYNPDRKCDSRCTGAKGHECSCACGGANHGADWGIQEVTVVTGGHKAPVAGGHLGEPGKHIVGEVMILSKRSIMNGDRMLYTFITGKGDVLKWFVPVAYDPDWQEGDQFTLRAKVQKHDNHEKFGKSTTVLFCEKKEG